MSRLALAVILVTAATAHADKYTVNAVVLKLPTIKLDAAQTVELAVGGVFTSRDVEQFCGQPGDKLIPLARIEARKPTAWILRVDDPDLELYAISGNQCFKPTGAAAVPQGGRWTLWARASERYAKSPTKLRLDIRAPEKAAAIELALGDDVTTAVSVVVDVPAGKPQWRGVVVKSTVPRDVKVYAFGGAKHLGFGHEGDMMINPAISGKARPNEPLAFDLFADGGSHVTIVAIQPNKTVGTERDIYGKPDDSSDVHGHELVNYSFLNAGGHLGMTRDSADLAARLFMAIDPAFFVYGVDKRPPCGLVPGEPVILIADGLVIHANGEVNDCAFRDVEPAKDYLSTKRPAKLAWPELVMPDTDSNRLIWEDEDFLQLADSDKPIAAYKAAKASTSACYKREWEKRDPNHVAGEYDIVSYSNGKINKVESFGDRVYRAVYAACKVGVIEKQREAIYKRLADAFKVEERGRLDTIAKRLATP